MIICIFTNRSVTYINDTKYVTQPYISLDFSIDIRSDEQLNIYFRYPQLHYLVSDFVIHGIRNPTSYIKSLPTENTLPWGLPVQR